MRPEHQRHGVGTALVERALPAAEAAGAPLLSYSEPFWAHDRVGLRDPA